MIYGQQSGQQAGSVWSIAMSTAMGNGIVPRSTEEAPARIAPRWPWSRPRETGEAMVAAPRA
ncbi:hypothetical protein [Microbacterium sp.]|uniref:hypothetical protein n=1 Tax=Microbacterium sp. TaxID=51671 RepID=UPI00391A1812